MMGRVTDQLSRKIIGNRVINKEIRIILRKVYDRGILKKFDYIFISQLVQQNSFNLKVQEHK